MYFDKVDANLMNLAHERSERAKGAPPELSVKTGPPAPLCETAKSGFDFRAQECHTSMASMYHDGPGLGEAR